DDPSNRDPAHLRNRVRHELLPLMGALAGRDPVPVLVRQAELFRAEAGVLEGLAAAIPVEVASDLAAAPVALSRRRVRQWLRRDGARPAYPPDGATVERVLAVARLEARACEIGGGLRVRRSGGRLRLEGQGLEGRGLGETRLEGRASTPPR
ncbi:MAG TPA: hypothetical protein VF954_04145, partial [Acidimicrobiales bacterium]